MRRIDFLSAGIADNETRTYHISRCKPNGKSYAQSIAEKLGVTYEKLIHANPENNKN